MKRLSIIIMAIVFAITFTTIAFAGNNKTEAGSGTNPAGKSDKPGFENGNAWWKNNECVEVVDGLESTVADLEAENEALKAEIAKLKEEAALSDSQTEAVYDAEPRKFAVYKMAADHPNTPNAYGVYTNFFIPEDNAQAMIENMQSGHYEVSINVTDPDGNVARIKTSLEAQVTPRDYYDHYVELILP